MPSGHENDSVKTYGDWLEPARAATDSRRCPVCGHRSLTPVRHSLNWLIVLLLGAALGYIVLDVAEDGRLDGSVWRAVTTHSPRSRPH